MGKNNPDPRRDRREPYNQPIKFYGSPNAWGKSDLLKLMVEFDSRMNERRLAGTIDERIGKSIGYKRAQVGLSVDQLARILMMPVARLKKIEAGKEKLNLSLVELIATALNCCLKCELT